MRPLKVIILSFFVLSVLVILFSLLIPANVKLSRAITIQKPLAQVKNEIAILTNWGNWNTGVTQKIILDSGRYNAVEKSLTVKKFNVKIIKETDTSLQIMMRNEKGEELSSNVLLLNHNDSCTVNWVFNFQSKWYPWEKFRNLFIDNMYGPGLDSNLTALKKYIEKP